MTKFALTSLKLRLSNVADKSRYALRPAHRVVINKGGRSV